MPTALWILHNYPPIVLGGGEFAAHRLNKWLLERGWTVRVYIIPGGIGRDPYPSEFEGVPIEMLANPYMSDFVIPDNAVLLSQLWATRVARNVYDSKKCKYIEFVHYVDRTTVSPWPWTTQRNFTMVYNSADTQKRALEIAPWLKEVPSHIVHPIIPSPSTAPVVRTDPQDYPWITLVNFSNDKGAGVLNAIAALDGTRRKYAAVKGAHGEQRTPHESITLLEPTLDMESVWAQTRILVVPSTYETWCMVASEALARGIPVVAADHIPALKENCGDAARYVTRDDPRAWIATFGDIEADYAVCSARALARNHDSKQNLERLFAP